MDGLGVEQSETVSRSIYDSFPLPLGLSSLIRVINIQPSTTPNALDPMRCTFRIIDIGKHYARLSDHPWYLNHPDDSQVRYTALSYTWDDASADGIIYINDEVFVVQDNLWRFLHRARDDGFFGALWIDALCINQSTVKERNHQVSMMVEICKIADRVIVWLCPMTEQVEDTMQLGFARGPAGHAQSVLAQHLEGITEFCTAPYWSRAWIVQEYVLAQEISIWYGTSKMHEENIPRLFRHIWPGGIRHAMKDTPAREMVNYRE